MVGVQRCLGVTVHLLYVTGSCKAPPPLCLFHYLRVDIIHEPGFYPRSSEYYPEENLFIDLGLKYIKE